MLYGATSFTGLNGYGTVFQINTNGTGYATLHDFQFSTDGARPTSLIEGSDGVLYGTTRYGGVLDSGFGNGGTVFSMNENDGSCSGVAFVPGEPTPFIEITPKGLIEDSDGTLYGVTAQDSGRAELAGNGVQAPEEWSRLHGAAHIHVDRRWTLPKLIIE